MKPVIYVIVNKSLRMSAGKMAAQVGHAVAGLLLSPSNHTTMQYARWMNDLHRWLIVLEAEDDQHLTNIRQYLAERDVQTYAVIDEGINEVRPFSVTAVAVQILDKDGAKADLLSPLGRYRDHGYHVYSVDDIEFHDALSRVYRDDPKWLSRRGRLEV